MITKLPFTESLFSGLSSLFKKNKTSDITKETRNEAYAHVSETLSERQRVVFENLHNSFENGATAKELAVFLHKKNLVPSSDRNSVHPRLNELRAKGLVEIIGKKTCQYTDRKVAIYTTKLINNE
ncbi:hypothetical protein MOD25_05050 [Bacillus haynesii]|uniref:hypothetical protein n=1 Tax=Bacillus haynesii TaxID=1925021 RepID=UPI00227E4696|nr:hypothetical protein [Bacillus haynesii]MCY8549273.1 hypothetical protein [Bacillus haynesii]